MWIRNEVREMLLGSNLVDNIPNAAELTIEGIGSYRKLFEMFKQHPQGAVCSYLLAKCTTFHQKDNEIIIKWGKLKPNIYFSTLSTFLNSNDTEELIKMALEYKSGVEIEVEKNRMKCFFGNHKMAGYYARINIFTKID